MNDRQSEIGSYEQLAEASGRRKARASRPVVCIQGLGFVGFAMAVAVADAREPDGSPCFNVVGIDLPTAEGNEKVRTINEGRMPLVSADRDLEAAFLRTVQTGNLVASTDPAAYRLAAVSVVDIHLDVEQEDGAPKVRLDGFRAAIRTLGEHMQPGSLVIVETTVPPGCCEKVVAPTLVEALERRDLPAESILVAHSYERVMPGREYFRSIVNFPRVYSGLTGEAADRCEAFLRKVINVADHPLTRLQSTTASEIGKVLENSYRAVNIAFIEEWGRFAEAVGVDLFEVLEAIRVRPTHNNIRQPGFGVGGYCLTKDPLLGQIGARDLFALPDLGFPFSARAVKLNSAMPLVSLDKIRGRLHTLAGKTILLLGVSYRQDVSDTRYSPSETFVRHAEREGARVICHDPLVREWTELDRRLPSELPSPEGCDGIVFAVPHRQYCDLDLARWLGKARPVVLDANNVLSRSQRETLQRLGCPLTSIGRGT